MLAEWSVESSAEDPVLVVPWSDASTGARFVDLRNNPYDFDAVPEAEQNPPLMHALRALNAARSPFFTAKCDAWKMDGEELESLRFNLDLGAEESAAGFASYIDILPLDRTLFSSFPKHEHLLRRLTRAASALGLPYAALDCVLRCALTDFGAPRQGLAITLYVKAAGHDEGEAYQRWTAALESVVAIVRARNFMR
jgi:hypothetical protein